MIKLRDAKADIFFETIYESWFKIELLIMGEKIEAVRFGCVIIPYEPFLNADEAYAELIYKNHSNDTVCENTELQNKERAKRLRIALNLAKLCRELEEKKYNLLWLKHKIKKEGL